MNLPPPPTKFSKYNKMLLGATKDVCDATMKDAVKEAVQENQNIRDIPVAVDGTWQKGYSSMNVVTVTVWTQEGDTEILSKHCVCKDKRNMDRSARRTSTGIVEEWKSMELYRYFSALFNAMMPCYETDGISSPTFQSKDERPKLSDGKALCGKNRLTEASIDQLQTYYGLAIRKIIKCEGYATRAIEKNAYGNTQNPNESINNVIWSRVPKKTFVP
ncbi:uncharacterized protein TNCV_4592921 [Trichonephila clavipes]|nr:uncharacterized protein TNCV_4592921 [Trichonephila clavipes]